MSRRSVLGDDVLVRRAARGVAWQVGALVAMAMLLLVVLVTFVVVRGQARAADELLRSTASSADDVGDPPPGAWLVITDSRGIQSTPGLPDDVGPQLERLRQSPPPTAVLTSLSGDEREYRVATQRRGSGAIQVVLDLTNEHEQRARLLRAMAVASGVALLFAVLLGVLLGRRAVRPLAEALALQRGFIADASHELRTPLTLLSTRAQVLDRSLRSAEADPRVLADAHGVVQDVQRLGQVVEDLLVAADPREQDVHEPVDVEQVVDAVVASAAAHATEVGVALTAEAEAPGRCSVTGSEVALRRAVLALVDNAIDHTPAGGDVAVRIRRDRRDVVVAVSDTGPGIAPDAAQQVLRRFHSGGQRAGRAHYGLGLALTHDVANRHGGQLRLGSADRGAVFELVLPARNDT